MRRVRSSLLLLSLLLASACSRRPAQTGTLPLATCELEGVPRAARCGSLEVPIAREGPDAGALKLSVAVVPALANRHGAAPLFLLAGGPGQSAQEIAGPLWALLEPLARTRDLVFMDQRGTGKSHPLPCSGTSADAGLAERWAEDESLEVVKRCLATYDVDVRHFGTRESVADLEAVREALGAPRVDLYGASYGTRLGIAWVRAHPDHIRSATLDSVVPPSFVLPLELARDAQTAWDGLVAECAADAECHKAHPELATSLGRLLATFDAGPRKVRLLDPQSGEPLELELSREGVAATFRMLTYSAEGGRIVPSLIARALVDDWGPFFAATASSLTGSEGISQGLFLSVMCREDAPFADDAALDRAAEGTFLGSASARRLLKRCSVWPKGAPEPELREPLKSDVPVLLMSGQYDPVTPPRWAEEVLPGLTHGVHVIAPGVGHNAIAAVCARKAFERFLDKADPEAARDGCKGAIGHIPFVLGRTGSAP